jgi:hypothetical protein
VCFGRYILTLRMDLIVGLFGFMSVSHMNGGTRWRNWLRHWGTSRNVADSIPDGVTGIFH